MPVKICPRCQQRYTHSLHDVDFVHECNSGDTSLDQEDIVKIGNYTDEKTGSSVYVPNAMMQGIQNRLWGSRAAIEGEDTEGLTDRGARASTHRTRQHYEYIDLKGE